MRVLRKFLVLFIPIIFCINIAQSELTIRITQGTSKQTPIAIVPFELDVDSSENFLDIPNIVTKNLERSGRFKAIPREDMLQKPSTGADVDFDDWSILGIETLVVGRITQIGNDQYSIQFQLFDIFRGEQIFGYRMSANQSSFKYVAHRIADMIFEKITGIKGVFSTQVAYVTADGNSNDRFYKLVISDSDGENERIILESNDPIMSPAWSPDSRQLAYVSFEGNLSSIFIQTLRTGNRRKISDRIGINGSPAFSPDGRKLVLTLSNTDGNLDIHTLDLTTRKISRLTTNRSIDTEGTWSPDGSEIYFTSDRGGSPQIYKISSVGGAPSRITFEGNYNARPRLSPDGKKLAIVHLRDGRYQIGIIDIEKRSLLVLSTGSQDESPSFAPNSDTLIYATRQDGLGFLETVTADGLIRQRLASQLGNVREPVWSPFPRP
jgi:TolB protein